MQPVKEYFRYLPPNHSDDAWGLQLTGAGYQPVGPGGDPIPRRRHPPGHVYRWADGRVLDEYGLVYVSHGRGEFDSAATGPAELAVGDVALLFPGVRHRYRPHPVTGWGIYWLHFRGQTADRLRADGRFAPERALVQTGVDETMLVCIRSLLDVLRSDMLAARRIASAKTLELLARLEAAALMQQGASPVEELVRQACLLLEESPGTGAVVEGLIGQLSVGRAQFFRIFKQQTGMSPYRYRLAITIRRAAEMLRESSLSIKQIAAVLGFKNPYHFSKLFRQKVGCPPKVYRESRSTIPEKTAFVGPARDDE